MPLSSRHAEMILNRLKNFIIPPNAKRNLHAEHDSS
jgi:hypothetical protein